MIGGGSGDEGDCWVDIDDPPTCADKGHSGSNYDYLCDGQCELKVIAYDEDGNAVRDQVCTSTDRTYEEIYPDKQIPGVTLADENEIGNKEFTKIEIICVKTFPCGCEVVDTANQYDCVPWDSAGDGTPGSKYDGAKASGDVCDGAG